MTATPTYIEEWRCESKIQTFYNSFLHHFQLYEIKHYLQHFALVSFWSVDVVQWLKLEWHQLVLLQQYLRYTQAVWFRHMFSHVVNDHYLIGVSIALDLMLPVLLLLPYMPTNKISENKMHNKLFPFRFFPSASKILVSHKNCTYFFFNI